MSSLSIDGECHGLQATSMVSSSRQAWQSGFFTESPVMVVWDILRVECSSLVANVHVNCRLLFHCTSLLTLQSHFMCLRKVIWNLQGYMLSEISTDIAKSSSCTLRSDMRTSIFAGCKLLVSRAWGIWSSGKEMNSFSACLWHMTSYRPSKNIGLFCSTQHTDRISIWGLVQHE
jgi:hypothetical protein